MSLTIGWTRSIEVHDGVAETFAHGEWIRGSYRQVAHLGRRFDPGLASRTFGHHQDTDGLNGTVNRPGIGDGSFF